MFRTRRKFMKTAFIKVVQSDGKWYCFFVDGIRQGDTEAEAIENAYQLWKRYG